MAGDSVFLIDGARTPFGTFGGGLKDVSAMQLGVIAAKAAIERSHVKPEEIDACFFGNVIQGGRGAAYIARHIALRSGMRQEAPALTVNRLCGSGLEAIVQAYRSIRLGEVQVVLSGGTESMSQAPYHLQGARFGWGLGGAQVLDALWDTLTDDYCGCQMADTAENLSERYHVTREEQDAFSLLSHERALAAWRDGLMQEEVVAVKTQKGEVARDEHMRETSLEKLGRLQARFRENGTVTAGNASGINDGAAAVIVAGGDAVERLGLKPLGRIAGYATVGVDPTVMGIGPVTAIQGALKMANWQVADVDRFEVNEAFAAQYLAVEKELGLPRERTNVQGGAIALGHPVGASGARLALSLLYQLRRANLSRGVASLCIGGGQGIAMAIERV
ncbi:MAG: acetyl-CoA C-acetyltransferase [Thermaerobacter sp.]|nr:acetyl-CoA C-acetyltransferase [Thermaerobacter sp.]